MIGDIIRQIDVCYKSMARINNGTVTVGMVIGPNTRTFLCEMEKLAKLLLSIESAIGSEIKNEVKMILTSSIIHPFAYGRLQAYLKCLSLKYKGMRGCKKIFISHSSKDSLIVDGFVTLLIRGAGLSQDDIFCTSVDGMKISNGNDLREHIYNNIIGADLAILLVSKRLFTCNAMLRSRSCSVSLLNSTLIASFQLFTSTSFITTVSGAMLQAERAKQHNMPKIILCMVITPSSRQRVCCHAMACHFHGCGRGDCGSCGDCGGPDVDENSASLRARV